MLTKNFFVLLMMLLLAGGPVSRLCAQTAGNDWVEKAEKFFKEKKYMNALALYEEAITSDKNNVSLLFKAGICYLQLEVPETAYDYFKLIPDKETEQLEDFHYWYARICYMNTQFDSAMVHINTYLEKPGRFPREAASLLSTINDAIAVARIPNDYSLENPGEQINTNYSEMAPLISRDMKKITFTRSTRDFKLRDEGKKNEGSEELLVAEIKADDSWAPAAKINSKINSPGHDVGIQLLDDDKRMLLCQDGELKMSDWVNGEWRQPYPIQKGINSSKAEVHGCIYDFGNKIIFASDMGTRGDLDLYESVIKRDGTWSTPRPLEILNSAADENTPFIANNGKVLYFSSKGHYSMGGYDVFRSDYDPVTKQWSKPVNLGTPVNSVGDDWYFVLREEIGYLTSNRIGGMGGEDIYRVYLFSKVKLSGRVYHRTSGHVVPGCLIRFSIDEDEYEVNTDEEGNYSIELPFHKPLRVKVFANNKALYEETLKLSINPRRPRTAHRNYYIDYGEVAQENADSYVGYVHGSVRDFVSSKPLDAIVQLLDPVTNRVLKTTTTDVSGSYSIYLGAGKGNFIIEASRKGYFYYWKEINTETAASGKLEVNLLLKPLEVNSTLILNGISFESNSDVLRSSSFPELNKLYIFLNENSEITAEIGGHTDSQGSADANMQLSEDRAKSVVYYLVNKGIDEKRLIVKGYGQTRPLATNNQEEEGRELNRRIEVKILK